MFDKWACSEKKLIAGGALGGTRGRCSDEPTRKCMVCRCDVRELETKKFVVLNYGHWICVGCAKGLCRTMAGGFKEGG
jgi:hypothetical protein